jgi:hypothetical protein
MYQSIESPIRDNIHFQGPSAVVSLNETVDAKTVIGNTDGEVKKLIIAKNEAFLRNGAQGRLCKHIERTKKEVRKVHSSNGTQQNIELYAEYSCQKIHEMNRHGNFILGYYGMKLAALAFEYEFEFACSDKPTNVSSDYLLWWLQTDRQKRTKYNDYYDKYQINRTLFNPPVPPRKLACSGMGKASLQYTGEYARRDLRNMAIALQPSFQATTKNNNGMETISTLDEASIHFRCGDVLSSHIPANDKNYGLLQFQAYKKYIPSHVKTIGIVTAPFSVETSRNEDRKYTAKCRKVVERLVSYLQESFPNTTINIRNDPTESIPMVMSRLILSKYTFCVRSTFCLFPAVATFGTSYVQQDGVAYFLNEISQVYDNIRLMKEPFLSSAEINERGLEETVDWLLSSR